jgi:hypothetical protein
MSAFIECEYCFILFKKELMMRRIIHASTLLLLLAIHAAEARPGKVVATIGVGMNPAGIAITPNGRYAYVANDNNDQISGDDTISVIDTCSNTVIATISDPSFASPYAEQPYTSLIATALPLPLLILQLIP